MEGGDDGASGDRVGDSFAFALALKEALLAEKLARLGDVGDAIVVLRPTFIVRDSVSGAEGGGGRLASRCADVEDGSRDARQRKHSPVP